MNESFKNSIKAYLESKGVQDVVDIVGFDDYSYVDGWGCDTCGYGTETVNESYIRYSDSTGQTQTYTINDTFSNLLQELLSV